MLSSVFLASLLSGLLMGVLAMLTGVRRTPARASSTPPRGASAASPVPPPSPLPSSYPGRPGIAAAATMFGLVGSLLLRYTPLPHGLVIALAGIGAGLGMAATLTFIARRTTSSANAGPEGASGRA